MNRIKRVFAAAGVLFYLASCAPAGEEEWIELFNGETLDGWSVHGGLAKYRVEDGAIVGRTAKGSPNSFLCSVEEYGDFELQFEVKLFDNELNSGVQIRSQTREAEEDETYGRVNGPQVEIAAPGVNIISTIPGGRYGSKSGTSMATPHVTGVAALVKQRHPSWHGDHIRRQLCLTALDLGSPGRDWLYGCGQVNAWRAVTAP